jgi:hypothetical protein
MPTPLRHLLLPLLLSGCSRDFTGFHKEPVGDISSFSPSPAVLHRLTDAQYRASLSSLLGIDFAGELPVDYLLYNFSTVGASQVTIAPSDFELYEAAAWSAAESAFPDKATASTRLGCELRAPLGEEDLGGSAVTCLRPWAAELAGRAWRRPLEQAELDRLVALYESVESIGDQSLLGLRAVTAAVLLSPDFLFRVELGEPDPEDPSRRRYTSHEMASRLSYLLTGGPPDATLRGLADEGVMTEPGVLHMQARRLLQSEEAPEALAGFFGEYMDLASLATMDKDPTLYPQIDEVMREVMAEEAQAIFAEVAVVEGADLRSLFNTDVAYVDPDLGAIYGLTVEGSEGVLQRVELSPEAGRGGLLGRAFFLAGQANATRTSPTYRGKFVQTRLLCRDIPPPPPGAATEIENTDPTATVREKLEQHMTDPSCAGCHQLMDPIGFAFEGFDAIGQAQSTDQGKPIDDSAELDGFAVQGAAEMGAALAAHEGLSSCFTLQFYRHGTGNLETEGELDLIEALGEDFAAGGATLEALVLGLVVSEGFRIAAASELEEEPAREACNALDDDLDGQTDEDILRSCGEGAGRGLQTCVDGEWSACETGTGAAPVEECNGVDDDGDSLIDEALEAEIMVWTGAELLAAHESCDLGDPTSGACQAAASRICGGTGCYATGYGMVAVDEETDEGAGVCVSGATVISGSLTELGGYHSGCASSGHSADCNAAIHRYCSAAGLGTGFGPMEHSGDSMVFACTPSASLTSTTYTALAAYDAGCDGSAERIGANCNSAMHQHCRALGYLSGFGPIENSGDTVSVACVGSL